MLVPYGTLAPSASLVHNTYVGHAWRIREGNVVLGFVAAIAGNARRDIR